MAIKVAVVVTVPGSESVNISVTSVEAARRFSQCFRTLIKDLAKQGTTDRPVADPVEKFTRCIAAR